MLNISAELQQEVADLYKLHAGELLRFAESLTRQGGLAHDAVQETFLRYFIERRYGRHIEKPRTWLYTVMRNYLQRRMGSPEERFSAQSGNVDSLASDDSDPEALVLRAEAARNIVAGLSNRERQCLDLRLDGLGYAEIAETLGVRPGTVGALLARVHAKVRCDAEGGRTAAGTAGAVSWLAVTEGVYLL